MAPKTVKNHLGVLRVMFKVARRWRLVHANPVDEAEMPRVDVPEMSILTETEIAALLATYRRLEQDAHVDAGWWRLARQVVEFALGTAMRRGEIIGLRWRDVELLERRVHVRETNRPRPVGHAEKPLVAANDGARAANGEGPRRGLAGEPLPQRRLIRVRTSRSRNPDRPDQALEGLHATRAKGCRYHEAVPAVARPAAYRAHARGGRR
jgi:integrase